MWKDSLRLLTKGILDWRLSEFTFRPQRGLTIDRKSMFLGNFLGNVAVSGGMQTDDVYARDWAYEEFGHAELGDPRRTARLVHMAAALAERPGGKVLDVFRSSADRQGAYDLLGNSRVPREAILAATETATVRRCDQAPWVHVAVDGTSLRLADRERRKDFGGVGSTLNGARSR